jgi:hypothetical protein
LISIGLVLVQLGKLSCEINANGMWRADEFAPCLEPVLFAASKLAGDLAVPKLTQDHSNPAVAMSKGQRLVR